MVKGDGANRGEAADETDWVSSLSLVFVLRNRLMVVDKVLHED